MHTLDWLVLFGTLLAIVTYGIYKTRGAKDLEGYLKGGNSLKWWTIGLSVMATQASAITFLSTPGQAYEEGMGFVQFYLGQPLAMLFVCIWVIPIYYKLKVYTAYEYLEKRFNLKIRLLAAFLFLVQRGLAAGITIYAPAIILSTILGWNLNLTNLIIGVLVILYTVSGGTKAVSVTQKQQMTVMMGGMLIALIILFQLLPDSITFGRAVEIAGRLGKMNVLDTSFDPNNKYTLWSGILGSFFLALSYFGTDQSQVQRYLGGKSMKESRLGLIMNAFVKVPMQFFILFIGTMVFVFYQFNQAPVFFNQAEISGVESKTFQEEYQQAEQEYNGIFEEKRNLLLAEDGENWEEITSLQARENGLRKGVKEKLEGAVGKDANIEDADYVFISFVLNYLPKGLVGLLLAVIFSAAMSSTAGELNALASTTTIDFYKRNYKQNASQQHYLNSSRLFTLMWGLIALFFASTASQYENLIEYINIIGSLFYGTILGIFLCAFFLKKVDGDQVFIAGIVAQAVIFTLHFSGQESIAYLWYNPIACLIVLSIAFLISKVYKK